MTYYDHGIACRAAQELADKSNRDVWVYTSHIENEDDWEFYRVGTAALAGAKRAEKFTPRPKGIL